MRALCAVVPEILEPSLQLAAAVLSSLNLKAEEISEIVDTFRRSHISDLSHLSSLSGGSLGYGWDAQARAQVPPGTSVRSLSRGGSLHPVSPQSEAVLCW
jgi:hypothetical protein